MITVAIPGRDTIEIEHIALDYNGTIAADGKLISKAIIVKACAAY